MHNARLSPLIALAAAATLALAACGGDDGNSEDAEITEAIEQAATSDSAEKCTEVQTQAFTEQTEFASGEAAVASCEQDAGDGQTAGDSVEVANIEVDGDSATADVTFVGGGFDSQQVGVSLVNEDGQWKLDSLDEFLSFDKDAFASALVEQAAGDDEVPQQVVDCVAQQVDAAGEEQITGAYLSGDEQQLVALFGSCFGQS